MKINNAKEYCIFPEINNSLELKHSYKEIQKIEQNEEYEKIRKEINEREEQEPKLTKKEQLNMALYLLVISIIPIVVAVLLFINFIRSGERFFDSFIGGCIVGFVIFFIELLVIPRFQIEIKDSKANDLSWKKMQYIPLTEGELTSLNIHNNYDYISFLNDFLTVSVEYFSFSDFKNIEIYSCAKPPKAILDEINKSLTYLDDADNAGYIDFADDEYVFVEKEKKHENK